MRYKKSLACACRKDSRLQVKLLQNGLVQLVYFLALSRDTFPEVVKFVENVAESVLNHIRLTQTLVRMRVHNDFYSLAFYRYVNIRIGDCRVSVIVYQPWHTSLYMYLFCSESLYLGVLVQCFVEHLDAYLRSFQHIERFHYYHIKKTIAH